MILCKYFKRKIQEKLKIFNSSIFFFEILFKSLNTKPRGYIFTEFHRVCQSFTKYLVCFFFSYLLKMIAWHLWKHLTNWSILQPKTCKETLWKWILNFIERTLPGIYKSCLRHFIHFNIESRGAHLWNKRFEIILG